MGREDHGSRSPEAQRFFKLDTDKLSGTVCENLAVLDFSYKPSEVTLNLFALTPGCVPTPSFDPHPVILNQFFDFVRKLQWRLCITLPNEPPRFGIHRSSRWPPAALVPSHVKALTRRLLHGIRGLLRASHSCHFPSHLPFLLTVSSSDSLTTCANPLPLTRAEDGSLFLSKSTTMKFSDS